jgi:O-methyltransferase involved in polyketide biosynthesis
MEPTSGNHPDPSRISPTAKLVAYWRSFSDIPFASEVARLVDAEAEVRNLLHESGMQPQALAWSAPLLEARYKAIVHALRREGMTQILELASGLSLRGLAMTEDPNIVYVETDLLGVHQEKVKLLSQLLPAAELKARRNLHFHTADVLSFPEIEAALESFDPKLPVGVVQEGLFHYLSRPEKETVARHVHAVLAKFGGVWITPDFITKKDYENRIYKNPSTRDLTSALNNATQRNMYESAFEDDEDIADFINREGFSFEVGPQIDGSFALTAAERLNVSADMLEWFKSQLKLWTCRLRV